MGRKSNFPANLKISIVESYLSGKESPSKLMQKFSIPEPTFRRWIMLYQSNGPEGLVTKAKNQPYSKELKTQAINDYLAGNESLAVICKKYHIPSDSIVRRWIKKYNGHEDIKSSNAGVFCKNFLQKVASNFSIVLQLHFPQCCKLYSPTVQRGNRWFADIC